jgi:4a-hydroxytetrahydrobiopterin dehydratase
MLTLEEAQKRLKKLKDWSFEINSIVKDISFPDAERALEFIRKINEIAEKKNSHPAIYIDSNNVRISLVAHSVNGLTEKDFEIAEEIDKIC